MFHIALYEPEIPPNTGNIIRLCANTNCTLHLIHPLGFSLRDKKLVRAGLDYHDLAVVKEYSDYSTFIQNANLKRLFACSTKGQHTYAAQKFVPGDTFLFGPETRGLPANILQQFAADTILKIPMLPTSRSLNLSNAVAIVLYEALRQTNFVFQ